MMVYTQVLFVSIEQFTPLSYIFVHQIVDIRTVLQSVSIISDDGSSSHFSLSEHTRLNETDTHSISGMAASLPALFWSQKSGDCLWRRGDHQQQQHELRRERVLRCGCKGKMAQREHQKTTMMMMMRAGRGGEMKVGRWGGRQQPKSLFSPLVWCVPSDDGGIAPIDVGKSSIVCLSLSFSTLLVVIWWLAVWPLYYQNDACCSWSTISRI